MRDASPALSGIAALAAELERVLHGEIEKNRRRREICARACGIATAAVVIIGIVHNVD